MQKFFLLKALLMLFGVIKRKAKMQKHVMKHSRKVVSSHKVLIFVTLTNKNSYGRTDKKHLSF